MVAKKKSRHIILINDNIPIMNEISFISNPKRMHNNIIMLYNIINERTATQ